MTDQSRRTFLKGAAGAAAVVAIEPELFGNPPRLSAPVSLGIVGCGRQARAILGEISKFEDVNVTALCDVDSVRIRSSLRRGYPAGHRRDIVARDAASVLVAHQVLEQDTNRTGKTPDVAEPGLRDRSQAGDAV